MSSCKKVSGRGTQSGRKGGEDTDGQVGPEAPPGPGLAPDQEPSPKHKSKGENEAGPIKQNGTNRYLVSPENCEYGWRLELCDLETAVAFYKDHEGQSDSSDNKEVFLGFGTRINDKAAETSKRPDDQVVQTVKKHPAPKRYTTVLSTTCSNAEAGSSRRGPLPKKLMDAKQGTTAPLHSRGPKGVKGRKKKKKRASKMKKIVPEEEQDLNSCSDSSPEEYSNSMMPVISVTISFKNGEVISSRPMEPTIKSMRKNGPLRNNFDRMNGSLKPSATRGPSLGRKNLEDPCYNKKRSTHKTKDRSRYRYPGARAAAAAKVAAAAAAAAATDGTLPKTRPKRRAAPKKKLLGLASRVKVKRAVPSWGRRSKTAPVEPPSLSSVTTLPASKRSKSCSLMTFALSHGPSRKRSMSRATRQSQPLIVGDKGHHSADNMKYSRVLMPKPESPKSQKSPPDCSAKQPDLCMHLGVFSGGDCTNRATQAPENSQLLVLGQRSIRSNSPESPGDLEQLVRHCHRRVDLLEKHQYPPAAMGCGQCSELEEEVDKMKEKLEAMYALVEKLQAL